MMRRGSKSVDKTALRQERGIGMYGPRQVHRKNRPGFTLLEVIFAFLIMALLLGFTTVSFRHSIDQEGSRGLAHTLASDLRSARAEAQRSGKLVAFCLASDNKTNSLARSAFLRKGEQRGNIARTFQYGGEYDATIFAGTWPGAELNTVDIPFSWSVSTNDEVAIHFRPDGTAFSNDLPSLDGNFPLLVASSFEGSLNGPTGTVTAALHPHTIWVSATGAVSVEETVGPLGRLPVGESSLTVAELDLDGEPPESAPILVAAKFFPEQTENFDTATVGQNYVSIHPSQKAGSYLEYGIATIDIKATDADGGPLTYTLEATASEGEEGKFTVSNLQGQMKYGFDETLGEYVWHALISWRPPPSSPPDLEYELAVTLQDPEGNTSVVSSEAGLLPRVTSLPPSRIVMGSTGEDLFLTDLDGSNEVHITHDGGEVDPFFSADGSRIFSFHNLPGDVRELRSRAADGSTNFDRLATFTANSSQVHFDPTFTYAAVVSPGGTMGFPWGRWEQQTTGTGEDQTTEWVFVTGVSQVPVSRVSILNLMTNDPPILVTDAGDGTFEWAANHRHVFRYGAVEENEVTTDRSRTFHPHPGHQPTGGTSILEGYPPRVTSFTGSFVSAQARIYNPAVPNWYLEIEGDSLRLKSDSGPTFNEIVHTATGGFDFDTVTGQGPSWSADGRSIAFVAEPGSAATLVTMHVLDDGFAPITSFVPDAELALPGATKAQLSPQARWVYYLRNQVVYLAENTTGAGAIDISSHIRPTMQNYVVSP